MGVGSIGVAAWIAAVVLAILIVQALIQEKFRAAGIGVLLAAIGWLLVGRLNASLVTPYIAVLDIGLVFAVLGRDVRLN